MLLDSSNYFESNKGIFCICIKIKLLFASGSTLKIEKKFEEEREHQRKKQQQNGRVF